MKPPSSSIRQPRAVKQLRPKHKDMSLPMYTTPLANKYNRIEGVQPRAQSIMQDVGNRDAFAPHKRSHPIRCMSGPTQDPSFKLSKVGVYNPVLDRSIVAAKPFDGMSKLGIQQKTRFHEGNSDFKQKPLLVYSMGKP